MAGFSSLEIGKKALLAQKFGLDITSNNIANVNTPGYSRRVAILSEDNSIRKNGFFMGNSVVVQKIQSFRNEYYDREIRTNESKRAAYDVDSQFLKRVEILLGEPNGDTIDNNISEFFKTFEQASNNPENIGLRTNILQKAKELTDRFNNTAVSLQNLRAETIIGIKSDVDSINGLLNDIVDLNKMITNNVNKNDETSQKFNDEIENKIQELSKYIDIKVAKNEDSSVNIFVNGINLVTGIYHTDIKYKIESDPSTNEITANLYKFDSETGVETKLETQSGSVFSYLKLHNEVFDPIDNSSNFSVSKELNSFVNTFATKINDMFVTGFGLNDTNPLNPPNRYLFIPYDTSLVNPNSQITAFNIGVNNLLVQNPQDIPLSDKANEPGNTEIARKISNFANDKTFMSNLSPLEYYSNFISRFGNATKTAIDGLSNSKLIDEQLNSQRESFMGVNLDEEAVNLIKYQKSFEAASRIITMTNELMATVINLGR